MVNKQEEVKGDTTINKHQVHIITCSYWSQQCICCNLNILYHIYIYIYMKKTRKNMVLSVSSCKTKKSTRNRTNIPTIMKNFGLCIFTRSTHGHMQWQEVIWVGMSHFCIWGLLFIFIHFLVPTLMDSNA